MQIRKGGGKMSKVNKGGRPSVYETKIQPFLHQIHILRSSGLDHEQIWPMLNIARSTYYKHKKEIEGFSDLLKKGDEDLVEKLEKSLYQRAIGGMKKVVTTTTETQRGKSTTIREEETEPSDVALFFALTNLAPDKWKHKQDLTVAQYDDEVDSFADALKDKHDKS